MSLTSCNEGDLRGRGGEEQEGTVPVHGSDVHPPRLRLLRPGRGCGGCQAVRGQGRPRLFEAHDKIITFQ